METIEHRVTTVEARGRALEERMADHKQHTLDMNTDLKTMIATLDARMEHRFDTLDRRFIWVVALQFATLLAILGATLGIIGKLV